MQKSGFADKYLNLSNTQRSRAYLGQKDKRLEKITVGQAANIAKQERTIPAPKYRTLGEAEGRREDRFISDDKAPGKASAPKKALLAVYQLSPETGSIFVHVRLLIETSTMPPPSVL